MEFTGEVTVDAPRQVVFEEMQKPEMLQKTIPNCESVEKIGENKFKAIVDEKISKISMKLETEVELTELREPDFVAVSISGDAPGSSTSVAANGSFELEEANGGDKTLVHYTMDMEVSGKLASIGFRMIKHVVKKRIDEMVDNIQSAFEEAPAK